MGAGLQAGDYSSRVIPAEAGQGPASSRRLKSPLAFEARTSIARPCFSVTVIFRGPGRLLEERHPTVGIIPDGGGRIPPSGIIPIVGRRGRSQYTPAVPPQAAAPHRA